MPFLDYQDFSIENDKIDILSEPSYPSLFPTNPTPFQEGKIRVLSLFSGCGGMDVGLEGDFICHKKSMPNSANVKMSVGKDWVRLYPTRMQTVFECDILPEARSAWVNYMYKKNIDPSLYHLDSIVDLVNAYKKGTFSFPEKIDIVTGGFPCQDFSVAGKRKGFGSTVSHKGERNQNIQDSSLSRGKLYCWMKEVINITKPKVFIAENVKGLINLGDVKEIIRKDFSEADGGGYYVFEPKVLHAADYGVPESRERVIFIGVRKEALNSQIYDILIQNEDLPSWLDPYPQPTHSDKIENGLSPRVTCEDVLGNLEEPEKSTDPSHHFYSKAKYLGNGSQGQTEINYKGIGPTIRAEHHGNIEFRRLSKENGGKNYDELARGLPQRRLTPRECALIQTFPPDYNFVLYNYNRKSFAVSPSMSYKIIGNAVPPVLAYNISKRLEELWPIYFK